MISQQKHSIFIFAALLLPAGCSKQDEDFIPYELTGMNAWVYDPVEDESFLAGFSPGSYETRRAALSSCAAVAETAAISRGLSEWSHVCYTVTPDSDCFSKVR